MKIYYASYGTVYTTVTSVSLQNDNKMILSTDSAPITEQDVPLPSNIPCKIK